MATAGEDDEHEAEESGEPEAEEGGAREGLAALDVEPPRAYAVDADQNGDAPSVRALSTISENWVRSTLVTGGAAAIAGDASTGG